jgi:predicted SAM-dependent methyltransferase
VRLNVGCGQDILTGDWINIDKYVQHPYAIPADADNGLPYPDNDFDEVRCHGCLNEFKEDVVFHMNEFWRVLKHDGILDIVVAVVDDSRGPFRDPIARRYLHSQWAQYFFRGGSWENSGHGLGFKGEFILESNEVAGEKHHVVLKAVKAASE